MGISYKKLFHLMIDRGIRKTHLQLAAHISASTLAKLGHDEYVALDVLVRICVTLGCDIGDICEITNKTTNPDSIIRLIADDGELIPLRKPTISNPP